MLSAFLHIVSSILNKFVVKQSTKWEDKKILEEEKENYYQKEVKLTKAMKKAGLVWFVPFLIMTLASFAIWLDGMEDKDMFICGVLFLVIALFGVYILLLSCNYHISYTDTFLEKTDAFGRKSVYRWDELKEVRKKGAIYHLTFSNGTFRFPHNKEYIGSGKLVKFIEKLEY